MGATRCRRFRQVVGATLLLGRHEEIHEQIGPLVVQGGQASRLFMAVGNGENPDK